MKNNVVIIAIAVVVIVIVVVGLLLTGNGTRPTPASRNNLVSIDKMVGQPLPDIKLTDQAGAPYNLSQLKGKNVVLFFSEGLMCYPACWNQMAAFGTDQRFNSADMVAISVLADSPEDWQKAASKMPDLAKATTLFDRDGKAVKQLDLLSVASSMHGGEFPGHTYMLIDKQGIIRRVLDDTTMSVNNDTIAEEITNL